MTGMRMPPHDSSNPLGPLEQGRLKLALRVFDVCYPGSRLSQACLKRGVFLNTSGSRHYPSFASALSQAHPLLSQWPFSWNQQNEKQKRRVHKERQREGNRGYFCLPGKVASFQTTVATSSTIPGTWQPILTCRCFPVFSMSGSAQFHGWFTYDAGKNHSLTREGHKNAGGILK